MAEYTLGMENELFETMPSYDEEEDCKALIDILNSSDFRSFGEALTDVIKSKMDETTMSEADFLISKAKEKGINIADNRTVKSWFKDDKRPKKGEESRFTMFKIAFALNLSDLETKKLFETVYLDRAYNPRDYKDVIYFYCLRNKKTLDDAQHMIEQILFAEEDASDKTIYTQVLLKQLESSEEESNLIEYINNHPHNFKLSNVTALRRKNEYLEKAKECAKRERQKDDLNWQGEQRYSYGRNQDSTNFLYETITGYEVEKAKGTKVSFKNALLPKEIKSCFPTPHTLSSNEPTYEELRKLIILLFSYVYWSSMEEDEMYDFDDYRVVLDMLLTEIGYLPLYAGNPYDWLFLRCTISDHPLEFFREILFEVNK